jgi:hypothetical protein
MFLFCLVFCAALCSSLSIAHADIVPPSRRTGVEFDSVDVRYFRLFPRLDFLRSFRFSSYLHSDSVLVEARRSSQRDTVFAVHSSTATAIIGYVDNFEAIFTGRYIVEWDRIASFISPVRPMLEPRSFVMKTLNGAELTGILFTANDSLLLLYTGNRPDDWTSYAGETIVVSYHNIATVNNRYIGGNREIFTSSLPYLREHMLFWGLLPPECTTIVKTAVAEAVPSAADTRSLDEIYEEHYLRRWHITAIAGASHMATQFDVSRALGASVDPEHDPRRYDSYPFAGLDVYYSFTRRFHAGIFAATFPWIRSMGHGIRENILIMKGVAGWTAGATAMYNILAVSPQLDEPLQWSMGGGVVYNHVIITTTRDSVEVLNPGPVIRGKVLQRSISSENSPAFGMVLRTALEYFFTPWLSMRLSGEAAFGGSAVVTSNSRTEDTSIPPVTASRKTHLDINRLHIIVGIGMHL